MVVMDATPAAPAQFAQILIAQASRPQNAGKTDRTIGVCQLIDARPELQEGAVNVFSPLRAANYYFKTVEQKYPGLKGSATLLQGPEHGELEDLGTLVTNQATGVVRDTGVRSYSYHPKPGYLGADHATFLVEIGSLKVKAVYFFKVLPRVGGGTEGSDPYKNRDNCPQGEMWKISLNPGDAATGEFTFNYPQPLPTFFANAPQANLTIADVQSKL
jgi:hypothetical protein